MADMGGKHFMKHSTEKRLQTDLKCGSCEFEGISKQSDYLCTDCWEYLCASCEKTHRKLKATRNHAVIAGFLIPPKASGSETTRSTIPCSCETEAVTVLSEEVTIYCKDHNDIFCRYCKSSKHDSCRTSSIMEASLRFEKASTDNMIQRVNEVRNKVATSQKLRNETLENFKRQVSTCLDEVTSFKEHLYLQLDLMEESTLAELDRIDHRYSRKMQKQIDLCNDSLQKLESETNLFQMAKNTGDKEIMFIRQIQLQKTLENINIMISDTDTNEDVTQISFYCDQRLRHADTLNLGRIESNKVSEVRKEYGEMSVRPHRINIKPPSDAGDPKIAGSVFMPNGELVLCDKYNENVKVLNADFTPKGQIDVRGEPWDIAVMSNTKTVITLPFSKMLQYVQVRPALKLGRTIQLDKVCRGVAACDGSIYVSFVDGEILQMDRNGVKLKSYGLNPDGSFRIKRPYHIAISKNGNLYFSDDDALTCMTPQEKVLYSYRNSELKTAYGMCFDNRGSLFICGEYDNIHIMDKQGLQLKVLYDIEGLSRPNTISFRHSDGMFVVGCEDQEQLVVFQME